MPEQRATQKSVVEKVTAFVLCQRQGKPHLALFEHPTAGIQIPAGTVEPDETSAAAVLREAWEETNLSGLTIQRYLGAAEDPPPPGHKVLAATTPIYARPSVESVSYAQLRRGLTVAALRTANHFTQICYQEYDHPDSPTVTLNITGWGANTALADTRLRHFFTLDFVGETAERWPVYTDQHWFTLFWAPLDNLPSIIAPQDQWVQHLATPLVTDSQNIGETHESHSC